MRRISEMWVALGIPAALLAATALWRLLPTEWAFGGGATLAALGLLVSVPTGLMYHLRLYGALAPRGELTRRWWLSPVPLNARLLEGERARVMPWFYLGAAGFVVAIAGCLLAGMAALRVFTGS